MTPLHDRLWRILGDGGRHGLRELAQRTDTTPGDVLARLTAAWDAGADIDADDGPSPDYYWWRTDVAHDAGLLCALRAAPDGLPIGDVAVLLRVRIPQARLRLNAARETGHVETTGRTAAMRYHITAHGRAALEMTP